MHNQNSDSLSNTINYANIPQNLNECIHLEILKNQWHHKKCIDTDSKALITEMQRDACP